MGENSLVQEFVKTIKKEADNKVADISAKYDELVSNPVLRGNENGDGYVLKCNVHGNIMHADCGEKMDGW
jgi:hypothetical protein